MRGHALIGAVCGTAVLALCPIAMAQTPAADPSAQTQPASQDPLAQLKKLLTEHPELIEQLKLLLDQAQKEKGVKPGEKPATPPDVPDIPPLELPGRPNPVTPGAGQTPPGLSGPGGVVAGTTRGNLTPDISVLGNHIGRFLSVAGDPERNRFQLGELEIGLQQPIYPGIRFDAFLVAGADEGFAAEMEEAYVTANRVGGLPLGGLFGKKRLNFGKANPMHPHSRLFVDQPAPLAHLVDPDALNGNGASINYLFPMKGLFANLELGLWNVNPSDEGEEIGSTPTFYPVGHGVTGNFPLARLWLSKELKGGGEVELGASHGFGRADVGDNIALTGLDFTYRTYPGTFKRFLAQGEVFWHRRENKSGGTGEHTRSGHYVLLNYKPDQYWDYGIRYDDSRFAWPLDGRDQSLSFILTNRLTEVTLLRFQYKLGDRTSSLFLPARRGYNELYLQFIWGVGSHTHPLQ